MAEEVEKNCFACAFSGMEPDDPRLICGHPDSGPVGKYVDGPGSVKKPVEHCGPERTKFEQHPLRNANGSLKSVRTG